MRADKLTPLYFLRFAMKLHAQALTLGLLSALLFSAPFAEAQKQASRASSVSIKRITSKKAECQVGAEGGSFNVPFEVATSTRKNSSFTVTLGTKSTRVPHSAKHGVVRVSLFEGGVQRRFTYNLPVKGSRASVTEVATHAATGARCTFVFGR